MADLVLVKGQTREDGREEPRDRVELRLVPLEAIDDPGDNVRAQLGGIEELAASIAERGLLQPFVVEAVGEGRWRIAWGFRRAEACRRAGLGEVTVLVRPSVDDGGERVAGMLVENLLREQLSALEEARAYRRLSDAGWSQRRIARSVGRNQSHVSKRLGLLGLTPKACAALDAGSITVDEALWLARLAEWPERLDAALDERRRWDGVEGSVRRAIAAVEAEQAVARARRELQARGIKIVAAPKYGMWDSAATVRPVGDEYGGLGLDVDEHRRLTCHAAVVQSDGEVIEVCRKPGCHAEASAAAAESRRARESAEGERERDRARRSARAHRRAFLRQLAGRKPTAAELRDALCEALAEAAWASSRRLATELVGIKVENGASWSERSEALARFAATGQTERHRAAYALALATLEERRAGDYVGARHARKWTDWLTERGFELDDDGRRILEEGAQLEAKNEGTAACRVCGCTEDEPCEGGCGWIAYADELCSRCAAQSAGGSDVAAAGGTEADR